MDKEENKEVTVIEEINNYINYIETKKNETVN